MRRKRSYFNSKRYKSFKQPDYLAAALIGVVLLMLGQMLFKNYGYVVFIILLIFAVVFLIFRQMFQSAMNEGRKTGYREAARRMDYGDAADVPSEMWQVRRSVSADPDNVIMQWILILFGIVLVVAILGSIARYWGGTALTFIIIALVIASVPLATIWMISRAYRLGRDKGKIDRANEGPGTPQEHKR